MDQENRFNLLEKLTNANRKRSSSSDVAHNDSSTHQDSFRESKRQRALEEETAQTLAELIHRSVRPCVSQQSQPIQDAAFRGAAVDPTAELVARLVSNTTPPHVLVMKQLLDQSIFLRQPNALTAAEPNLQTLLALAGAGNVGNNLLSSLLQQDQQQKLVALLGQAVPVQLDIASLAASALLRERLPVAAVLPRQPGTLLDVYTMQQEREILRLLQTKAQIASAVAEAAIRRHTLGESESTSSLSSSSNCTTNEGSAGRTDESVGGKMKPMPTSHVVLPTSHVGSTELLRLPLCTEDQVGPKRKVLPLGTDEDANWLSEFHCFVREKFIEVFCARPLHAHERWNNSISAFQVGLRCRFCAHLSTRAIRSRAFPSSTRQIYQSFTMMLRDHFVNCSVIPSQLMEEFQMLKEKPSQGVAKSKQYWIHAAKKIGMVDTDSGIKITAASFEAARSFAPFGVNQSWSDSEHMSVLLVTPSDRNKSSEYFYQVLSQAQPVLLSNPERIGTRRSLAVGLPGLGCRRCCEKGRLGLSRTFPIRRRHLPDKINDMYDHLQRCSLCPEEIKKELKSAKKKHNKHQRVADVDKGAGRKLFDNVWQRLGQCG